jgi:cytochrome c553
LPKTLTGEQVNEIMEQWESYLGVSCSTCHARDPKNLGPNGRPRMNYADDSKPEKSTARLMYTMTKDVNENYVSMVPTKDGAAAPTVTCGTCHRGKKDPEPFVISDDNPPSGASTPPAQK